MDRAKVNKRIAEPHVEKLVEMSTDAELKKALFSLLGVLAEDMSKAAATRSVVAGQESDIMYGLARAEGARSLSASVKSYFDLKKE